MKVQKLLYGAAYYDEYMPYDRIDEDMRMLSSAGMNVIRIAESTWSTIEPHDGVFDFTHLDRMLQASARYGIQVIIGTPTYAIPPWMAKKYPDILAITKNGQEIYGRRQNMDILSPDYRFHAERVIRQIMEHIHDIQHIIGFQLDNETTAYDTRGPRAQALFLERIRAKYPDINEFNHEFGLDYWSNRVNAWEDFPNVNGTINQSLDAEYKKFQRTITTEFLEWQAAIINEYKRPDQFLTQNFCFDWRGGSYGIHPDINQEEASKCLTVAGVDIYHPSAAFLTGEAINMGGTIGRSLKKDNYLVLETEAQGNPGWLPYEKQLRLQAFSNLANGANSVMYWHWHSIHNAIESYWKGVLSHNLKENATYRDVCQIGHEFAAFSDKLKNLQKHCRVAIMQSNAAMTGMTEFPISRELGYSEIFRWLLDSLYRMNVEADVVYENETALSDYEVLIVPALYAASEDTLARLKKYVAEGGNLIATFKSFFCDEQLKIYHDDQPHNMTEVFGMTYDRFTIPTVETMYFEDHGTSPGLPVSAEVTQWMELLEPQGADTLAFYNNAHWGSNQAAITSNHYGKGTAVYIGCYFDRQVLATLLEQLLTNWGIQLDEARFPLIIKRGINEAGRQITYLFNYSDRPQTWLYKNEKAISILNGACYECGDSILIDAWDLNILEAELS